MTAGLAAVGAFMVLKLAPVCGKRSSQCRFMALLAL
jgi:hypothetical protein